MSHHPRLRLYLSCRDVVFEAATFLLARINEASLFGKLALQFGRRLFVTLLKINHKQLKGKFPASEYSKLIAQGYRRRIE